MIRPARLSVLRGRLAQALHRAPDSHRVDRDAEQRARQLGLYAKARSGALPNFTGIDSPYERPESPEVHVLTSGRSIEECVDQVFAMIE